MPIYHTAISHIQLKVRDLRRSIEFYTRFFNLQLVEQVGLQYAFLSGGEQHHELALLAVGGAAPDADPAGVGLHHVAFAVPDRRSLALAYRTFQDAALAVQIIDHGSSWALYFSDPDGNGLELYCDTRHDADGAAPWGWRHEPLSAEQIAAALLEDQP